MTERKGGWVETYTGKKFYPLDPDSSDISLFDIAHALSQLGRFNGHSKVFYSVGQHSINVAKELARLGHDPLIQMYGLCHDFSEAYLSDITRPIKPYLTEYIDAEDKLMKVIWEALGLPEPTEEQWSHVRFVDDACLANEAKHLMRCVHWDLGDYHIIPNIDLSVKPMDIVEEELIDTFRQIATLLFGRI